jgi:uncharacterized protein (TIGR00270 family)
MGECEVCGAMNVSTRRMLMGRAEVSLCTRCQEKTSSEQKGVAPGLAVAQKSRTFNKTRKSKDIMSRGEKELAADFNQRIIDARDRKGWDKRELARRMAETLNVIQSSEGGKRPTNSVIIKFERILGIELMVEVSPDSERQIGGASGRGLTLGDYLNDARKGLDG